MKGRIRINLLLIFVCIFTSVFSWMSVRKTPANEVKELQPVEIREYEGEKLSSSKTGFRENSIRGPQYVKKENYHLEITGLAKSPLTYTYDEVLTYDQYKKVVTLNCVEGWSATVLWEGVLVRDVIANAGVLPQAKVVIFYAYDGYSTSFPLEYILDNDIIMAHKMNEIALPPERGFPFALVAEEKWGYKWIKWITKIELSDDVNYRGYWESRGYANTGDLDKSFLD